ncbi:MAG: ATPase P [Deltaproteobacteria bacterium]|nr:ATPase P [Deltaproteobacteria bacterium]
MIEIKIPGYRTLQLKYLIMDYNGTLSCDGYLLEGVRERLKILANDIKLHVLTADTFGRAAFQLKEVPALLSILPLDNQDTGKLDYVKKLGPDFSVCIGNGRNDRLMLKGAVLGIALIQEEGASVETLLSADVVCKDILAALDLLTKTKRLVATLRS